MRDVNGKIGNERSKWNLMFGVFLFLAPTMQDYSTPLVPEASSYGSYEIFPVEPELEARVDFWRSIYSKYNSWEAVIHDSEMPQVIYEVINDSKLAQAHISEWQLMKTMYHQSRVVKKKYNQLLRGLFLKREGILSHKIKLKPAEEELIAKYTKYMSLEDFLMTVHKRRIRAQLGLKDHFQQGLYFSGRYLETIKRIFAEQGLPEEIAYLPFVESSFNIHAMSKVGASGIWQFIPDTGRIYLQINEAIDERNDPIRAAQAAAMLLKKNFETLGSWPLAITAYNHGRDGIADAVRRTKSRSLSSIINEYDNPNFGFASANFYASFLAASEIAKNGDKYFGKIEKATPITFDEFVLPDYIDLSTLLAFTGIDLDEFKDLNPAVTQQVYKGKKRLPLGANLRIPYETSATFLEKYQRIPASLKFSEQK